MKTAILLCEKFEAARAKTPAAAPYDRLFVNLLSKAAPQTEFKVFDIWAMDFPSSTDDFQKYIITGSLNSAYDNLDWIHSLKNFISRAADGDSKIVGICFGHQIIAEALGGKVEASPKGWGEGIRYSRIKHPFLQKYFNTPQFALEYNHHDQVVEIPSGAEILSGSEFCPVESFKIGRKALAFQGHSEFDKTYADMLFGFFEDKYGEAAKAMRRAGLGIKTNSAEIARVIADF